MHTILLGEKPRNVVVNLTGGHKVRKCVKKKPMKAARKDARRPVAVLLSKKLR